MVEVVRHDPGAFSWAELSTTDPDSAKKFYTSLFGWTYVDNPMGPDMVYTRLQLGGRDAAAMYPQMKEQRAQGIPPNWMVYVTVADADDTAKRVKTLGGSVLQEPFDVMSYGRMAVCRDRGGAVFSVWQPGTHIGVQVENEPGALSWCELAANDTDAAAGFYAQLFGWVPKTREDFPYVELYLDGRPIGGIVPMDEQMQGMPPYWGIYFRVADCDASVAKAKSLGGKVHFGPKDIPTVGRFAMLQDPQGAMFSVIQLNA
jgi:predicted enzyme related to lactoylglutathione lyase